MDIFADEIKLIDKLENEIPFIIKRTIEKFGFVIIDYIANKQMDQKGEDGEGKKIRPKYTLGYARLRIKKGLQADHVDLHFSGKFHANLEIEVRDNEFVIKSNVAYDKYIEGKYGENLLLVQEQYLKDFVEKYIYPELKKQFNDTLTRT